MGRLEKTQEVCDYFNRKYGSASFSLVIDQAHIDAGGQPCGKVEINDGLYVEFANFTMSAKFYEAMQTIAQKLNVAIQWNNTRTSFWIHE